MNLLSFNEFGSGSTLLFTFYFTIVLIWILLVFFSYKQYGFKKTIRMFYPMMITALFLETAAVSSGRYIYPGYLININVLGGSVPLIILIGWSANLFLFTQLSMYTINRVYKCNNILQIVFISIGAGMIGVCLDLLEDTIANHNNWWRWTETIHGPAIFGVPISNFIDWFIILFFMSLVTQLIERSQVSENRKLLMSFFSIPVVGMSIFITHTLLLGTF